jgi:hypothetical protein
MLILKLEIEDNHECTLVELDQLLGHIDKENNVHKGQATHRIAAENLEP